MENERIITRKTQRRYDRIAPFYDFMEWPLEFLRFAGWRSKLTNKIVGPRVLEVGVGTGKNMQFYPPGVEVTGIDLSPRMLERARKRADNLELDVDLREMDAQNLKFPNRNFDTVFATFVFCSVPDPIAGLQELRRICKTDGVLLLIEHMRPENWWLGCLFDLLNPLIVRLMGANINRRTINNLRHAGWRIESSENLSSDIVRWIEAKPE